MRKTNLAQYDTASLTYIGKNYNVSIVVVDNKFIAEPYSKYSVRIDGVDYSMLRYSSGKTVFMRNELGQVSYANHKYDAGIINALNALNAFNALNALDALDALI